MATIPSDRFVFKTVIIVKPEHIDDLNHVNNVVYLQWVQDVASAHWNSAATEEWKQKCRWVVLRHVIEYHSPALLGDTLDAYTWIDEPQGAIQKRMVQLHRSGDQRLISTAETSWCLLDPITEKPRRISREISTALGLKY